MVMMNRRIALIVSLVIVAACGGEALTPSSEDERISLPAPETFCGKGTYFDTYAEACLPVYDEEPQIEPEPRDRCEEGAVFDEVEERCLPLSNEESPGDDADESLDEEETEADPEKEEEEEQVEEEPEEEEEEIEPDILYIHIRSGLDEEFAYGPDCIVTFTSYPSHYNPGRTRRGYAIAVDMNLDWSIPRPIDCMVRNGYQTHIFYELSVVLRKRVETQQLYWEIIGYSELYDAHYKRTQYMEDTSRVHPYDQED